MVRSIRRIFLIFILALFVFFTVSVSLYAQEVPDSSIKVDPTKIDIFIKKDDIPKIPNATLSVSAIQSNLTRVNINSTDFYEEQNRRFWISAESISFDNNNFNLTAGQTANIKLHFSLPQDNPPGSYVGRIIVRSENGGLAEIPVTIKLREDDLRPFLVIVAGVIFNLFINVSRWHNESEVSAKTAIELADNAIYKAEDEKRKDDRYIRAVNLQTQYRQDFEKADYKDAEEKAKRAKSEADSAKKPPDAELNLRALEEPRFLESLNKAGPILETTALKLFSKGLVEHAKKKQAELIIVPKKIEPPKGRFSELEKIGRAIIAFFRWLFAGMKKYFGISVNKKQVLLYGSLAIVIFVVMLQTWQAFYPRISDFGASTIDWITAFLFGFSGQSFLSAFADLGKRWLS